jgi:hypothetical protein
MAQVLHLSLFKALVKVLSGPGCLPLVLRKLAVGSSAMVLGGMGLSSGSAHALVVNVRGQLWNVSTFTGSYESNAGSFFSGFPWTNNSTLANEFAQAVGQDLGLPNEVFCSPPGGPCTSDEGTTFNNPTPFRSGPLFAHTNGDVGDGGVYVDYVFSIAYIDDAGEYYSAWLPDVLTTYGDSSVIWARATPVPGPLPIFGVAAAFGASRRLRKRLNASRKPL